MSHWFGNTAVTIVGIYGENFAMAKLWNVFQTVLRELDDGFIGNLVNTAKCIVGRGVRKHER